MMEGRGVVTFKPPGRLRNRINGNYKGVDSVRQPVLRLAGLVFWVGICFLVAWAGALVSPGTAPSDWYDALNKPAWNPPGWVFGPVWTALYIMMGVAAWVIWDRFGFLAAKAALAAFFIQLVLNGLWSRIFFSTQEPGWAFFEILLLLAAIVITTILFFKKITMAGWLMVPYMLWVGYASILNGAIWMMN
ncbi:tryptophan-rich sensory protein [Desulfosalsimonas propionicica]|uniref:Tryptophan-rich sensory protein n=2 Tax=Desulfosalsimonas propionicica TaxID=332175 RepID=A0A7W0HLV1_9BACT|nr:tryptophan-rich sensory protein [Desulfosalsimonas propionicica]